MVDRHHLEEDGKSLNNKRNKDNIKEVGILAKKKSKKKSSGKKKATNQKKKGKKSIWDYALGR